MDIFNYIREQLLMEQEKQLDEKLKLFKKIKELPEKALDKAMRYILKKAPGEIEHMKKVARKKTRR